MRFVLGIDQALADEYSKIKDASEVALKKLGASEVSVVLTAHASQKAPPDSVSYTHLTLPTKA